MSIVTIIFLLIIVGVVLYVINTLVPMDGTIKKIINIIVILAVLLWLAEIFGLIPGGHVGGCDMPRVR